MSDEQIDRQVQDGVETLEALANGEIPEDLPEGLNVSPISVQLNGDGTVTITLPALAALALLTGHAALIPPPGFGD